MNLNHWDNRPPSEKFTPVICNVGDFYASPNCLEERGFEQRYWHFTIGLGLTYNTLNNPNIPVEGVNASIFNNFHFTGNNHDYIDWGGRVQRYFPLGVEQYEITKKEWRKMGNPSLKKLKSLLKYRSLKEQLFKRKVLVTQARFHQMYEVSGNHAPFHAMPELDNQTPLRAYPDRAFQNYAIAAVSAEYRFPIMYMLEGTIFNEYGFTGTNVLLVDLFNPKNSWGFGVRLARRNIFLLRAQLAFHGAKWGSVELTIDQAY